MSDSVEMAPNKASPRRVLARAWAADFWDGPLWKGETPSDTAGGMTQEQWDSHRLERARKFRAGESDDDAMFRHYARLVRDRIKTDERAMIVLDLRRRQGKWAGVQGEQP